MPMRCSQLTSSVSVFSLHDSAHKRMIRWSIVLHQVTKTAKNNRLSFLVSRPDDESSRLYWREVLLLVVNCYVLVGVNQTLPGCALLKNVRFNKSL